MNVLTGMSVAEDRFQRSHQNSAEWHAGEVKGQCCDSLYYSSRDVTVIGHDCLTGTYCHLHKQNGVGWQTKTMRNHLRRFWAKKIYIFWGKWLETHLAVQQNCSVQTVALRRPHPSISSHSACMKLVPGEPSTRRIFSIFYLKTTQ